MVNFPRAKELLIFNTLFVTDGYKYYIKATDSSGRSANISYIAKVASPIKFFDAYFRMGFTNYFNELTPSSKVIYTIVEKLAKLIDSSDQVQKQVSFYYLGLI